MNELEEFSTSNILEHLPPLEKAPILEKLATLGMRRFQNEYALETPVDPTTGVVDHEKLMELMRGLVDPDYKWQAPFFDEHHLHWFAHRYETSFQPNEMLASEFRDMAINRMWVPRQFHDFVHAVTIPPDVPSLEQMRASVKDFRRKSYIYRISNDAITITERLNRVKRHDNRGDIMYIDPETKSITRDIGLLDQWREEFIHYIELSYRRGLIDLSRLSTVDLEDVDSIAGILPEIKKLMDEGLIRRKGRAALAVDIPYERVA
jgi:hypothetical protein